MFPSSSPAFPSLPPPWHRLQEAIQPLKYHPLLWSSGPFPGLSSESKAGKAEGTNNLSLPSLLFRESASLRCEVKSVSEEPDMSSKPSFAIVSRSLGFYIHPSVSSSDN